MFQLGETWGMYSCFDLLEILLLLLLMDEDVPNIKYFVQRH